MPGRYPDDFRQALVDRMLAGESVFSLIGLPPVFGPA